MIVDLGSYNDHDIQPHCIGVNNLAKTLALKVCLADGATCADHEGDWGLDSLKNHKSIGFHRITGPNPLEHHKSIQPAFIVGLSLALQPNNGVLMAGR